MRLHPRAERFDPPQHQPGIERRTGDAQRVDDVGNPLGMRLVPRDDATADNVGMAVEVFRRRVHDDVDAELERPLQVGGEERVVGKRDQSGVAGDFAHGRQVDEIEQGIARRLDPDPFRRRRDRFANVLGIAHVDEGELESPLRIDVGEEPIRSAINIVAGNEWSPGWKRCRAAVMADMPVEVALQSIPPSSDAMFSSSALRVGFPLRV